MKPKKLLSVCLSLALLLCLLPAAALPAAAEVDSWDALQAALSAGGTVTLTGDISWPEDSDACLYVPEDTAVTLDLNGCTIDCSYTVGSDTVPASVGLRVEGALTLTDSVGGGKISGACDCIRVFSPGHLAMTGGTIIGAEPYGENVEPAGVYLRGEGDRFEMTGGEIRGTFSGLCIDDGNAAISGGTISADSAGIIASSGAVGLSGSADVSAGAFAVNLIESSFTMDGGTVTGTNSGTSYGIYGWDSTIDISGGAVSASSPVSLVGGEITLSDGTISGDNYENCDVVDLYGNSESGTVSSFTMTGGTLANATRGVCLSDADIPGSDFTFLGGEIKDCKYAVYNRSGTVTLGGDAEIHCLHGIEVNGGTLTMSGGTIDGGEYGVMMDANDETNAAPTFTMTGGIISNTNYGVYLQDNAAEGVFELSGGTFYLNVYGVSVRAGSFRLSGAPGFYSVAADVALADGQVITVTGPLTNVQPICVKAATPPQEGDAPLIITSGLAGNGIPIRFGSTGDGCMVSADYDTGEAVLLFVPSMEVSDWAGLQAALDVSGTERRIVLANDITADAADEMLLVDTDSEVLLDLNGFTLTGSIEMDAVVQVRGLLCLESAVYGGTVTGAVSGVWANGGEFMFTSGIISASSREESCGVIVDEGGALAMSGGEITGCHDGVVLHGEDTWAILPGGWIYGNETGIYAYDGAKVTLDGTEITGNSGGGVKLDGSEGAMTAGCVSDNASSGVCVTESGSFTLDGGRILARFDSADPDNPDNPNHVGLKVSGAGSAATIQGGEMTDSYCSVFVTDGAALEMSGGEIHDNYASGVFIGVGGVFTLSGGTISGCGEAGVYTGPNSSFTMTGGLLLNNDTGIILYGEDAAADIRGGEISGGDYGAWVVNSGALTMSGGKIGWCETCGVCCGAEFYDYAPADFTMTGGKIFNSGDGVWLKDESVFTLSGGTICGNSYDGVWAKYGTFRLSGAPDLHENGEADVMLYDGMVVTVAGALSNTQPILVGAVNPPVTFDTPLPVTSGLNGGNFTRFASANANCMITSDDDTGEAVLQYVPATEISDWAGLAAVLETSNYSGRLRLANNITAAATDTPLTVPAGVTAMIDLNGYTLSGCGAAMDSVFTVDGGYLAIEDSSPYGDGLVCGASDAVHVEGGQFLLYSGTLTPAGSAGCGVAVTDGGEFFMSGGTVSGAPYVGVGAEFAASAVYLVGGEISGNGIGVFVGSGAAGRFGGSEISGNTYGGILIRESEALMIDGCVIDNASGVTIIDGAFAMTGGTIADNAYDGVDVMGGTFAMTGGEISGSGEDGVYIETGSFDFSGGTISGNGNEGVDIYNATATMTDGAITDSGTSGVVLREDSSVFTMTGGTISGSVGALDTEAGWYEYGSGVEVFAGNAEIAGGEIYGNVFGISVNGGSALLSGGTLRDQCAFWDEGQGDYYYYGGSGVELNDGTFTMTGGTIRANETVGIRVTDDAAAAISGGTITDNCNGVAVEEGGTFRLSGSSVFSDNNIDVFLDNNTLITVAGALTNATPISVEVETPPAAGGAVRITNGLPARGTISSFTAADSDYHIDYNISSEAVYAAEGYVIPYDDSFPTEPENETKGEEKKDGNEDTALPSPSFENVDPDAWYAGPAAFAEERGIFDGTGEGDFDPDEEMDRGMAVQVLWNYVGKPEPADENSFGDVGEEDYFAAAVAWAEALGITNGTDNGFDPDAPVTREMMFTMIYRYVKASGMGFEGLWAFELDFPDADQVSDWAYEGMCWLVMNGVVKGTGNGLDPKGVLTCAQAAALMERVAALLEA